MNSDLDKLSAEIARFREENARFMGRIETKVEGISETIEARETYAASYRRETRDKIEAVGRDLSTLKDSVTEMKPVVQAFRDFRSKAAGFTVAISVAGAVAGWLIAQFITEIKTAVIRFFH